MVRSMYSGVSGLRAHQTRMDTIGNNIANVNTYGFKSSRTSFRDIYYQSMSSAAAPGPATGGVNPSEVGYGAKVGSVDLMMSRSTFSMTDQTMDVAIDGDGFVQVMDGAGNIYYTRAGMLNFDAAGNLVDMQGNFVLGTNGDPVGRPAGSEKIKVSLPAVQPTQSTTTTEINKKNFTITAQNPTADGNLNMTFTTRSDIPDGGVVAQMTATGINVIFNPDNSYASWGAINSAINKAITEANGNKPHPAGNFTITSDTDIFAGSSVKASDLTSTNYGVTLGSASITAAGPFFGGITTTGVVGSTFTGGTSPHTFGNYDAKYVAGLAPAPDKWEVSLLVGGAIYKGEIDSTRTSPGTFRLKNTAGGADENDFIEMSRPAFATINTAWQNDVPANAGLTPGATSAFVQILGTALSSTAGVAPVAKPSTKSKAIGFSGAAFALTKGTIGGPQGLADMTGIAIAPNGVIMGRDSQGKDIPIGRIDIATFANQAGLAQAGSSNFAQSSNSGAAKLSQPGVGGAGKLVSGSLELSNVDLSREFSDMITTQRGYQANSRIITVSDTMLEELINLKR